MFVVVALTICAPSRLSTTWTDVPVRLAPAAGWRTRTTAGDEGRTPLEPGDCDTTAGLEAPPDPAPEPVPQPATRPANKAVRTAPSRHVAMAPARRELEEILTARR